MGLFGFGKKEKDKMKDGLAKTRTGFWGNILNTLTGSKIDDDLYDELEEQLILADVGGDVAMKLVDALRDRVQEKGLKTGEQAADALRDIIADEMRPETEMALDGHPAVILVIAVNGVGQKLSDCCCDIKQEIAGVNNGLGRAIERGFCDTNYNMQAQHNATMIAIDKVGDRVIDYLNSTRMQDLPAENQALRLAASQQAQNNYLVSTLRPTPVPSYQVQNPYCCNNGCGCGSF